MIDKKYLDRLRSWYATWTPQQKRLGYISLALGFFSIILLLAQSDFLAGLGLFATMGSVFWLGVNLSGNQEDVNQYAKATFDQIKSAYKKAQAKWAARQARLKAEREAKLERKFAEARRQDELRKQEEELRKQKEAQDAWFDRNYHANLFAFETQEDFKPLFYSVSIRVEQGLDWSPIDAIACVRALTKAVTDAFDKEGVGRLSIIGSTQQILWVVTIQSESLDSALEKVRNVVTPYYSNAQVELYQEPVPEFPIYRRMAFLGVQPYLWMEQGKLASELKREDPLTTLVGAMNSLKQGEVLRYDFVINSVLNLSQEDINNELLISAYDAGHRMQVDMPRHVYVGRRKSGSEVAGEVMGTLGGLAIAKFRERRANQKLKDTMVDRFEPAQMQRYVRKLNQPIVCGQIFVTLEGNLEERVNTIFDSILPSFNNFDNEYVIHTQYAILTRKLKDIDAWAYQTPLRQFREYLKTDVTYQGHIHLQEQIEKGLAEVPEGGLKPHKADFLMRTITPDEAAAYWHLPHKGFEAEAIQWAQAVPESLLDQDAQQGVLVGTVGLDKKRQVSIKHRDRAFPTVITGMPGMGKTTLLHNMIAQDIRDGRGVVAIDPAGDLINRILTSSISPDQLDRVVLLEVGNTEYPVPINPLRITRNQNLEEVMSGVLWMLHSLYSGIGEQQQKTRINLALRSLLPLMLSYEESVPFDMLNVIQDDVLRDNLLTEAKDKGSLTEVARDFWTRYAGGSPSVRNQMTGSTIPRLTNFLGSQAIELLTCHPHTLDYQQLITDKKIVLISLQGNNILADRGILGAIFFAQFYLASIALSQIAPNSPPRFFMYVDEADLFISTALPEMFAKLRQFGLSVTLATQTMTQFGEDVRTQLLANRGTFINFGTDDPNEAKANIKAHSNHLTPDHLINLKKGQAILKTRYQGNPLPSFIVDTFPEPDPINTSVDRDSLKQRARERVPVVTAGGDTKLGLMRDNEIREWWETRKNQYPYVKPDNGSGVDGEDDDPGEDVLTDLDPDYVPPGEDEVDE